MKNTRTGQRTIRKLLKGAGSAILLATLFVLVFAGTLSGAFGVEENLQQNGIIESNVARAATDVYTWGDYSNSGSNTNSISSSYTKSSYTQHSIGHDFWVYYDAGTALLKTNSKLSGGIYTDWKIVFDGEIYQAIKNGAISELDFKLKRGGNDDSNNYIEIYDNSYTKIGECNTKSDTDAELSVRLSATKGTNTGTSYIYIVRWCAKRSRVWPAYATIDTKMASAWVDIYRSDNTAPSLADYNPYTHTFSFQDDTAGISKIEESINGGSYNTITVNKTNNTKNATYVNDTEGLHTFKMTDNVGNTSTASYYVLKGAGTSDDPYLLRNRTEFDWLSVYAKNGYDFSGRYFKVQPDNSNSQNTAKYGLAANTYINMLGTAFTPIADYGTSTSLAFKGTINGNGCTLVDFVVNASSARSALIGTLTGSGKIYDLNIGCANTSENSSVTSTGNDSAAFVGFLNSSSASVENCVSYATIGSAGQNGGIVANIGGSGGSIRNCHNYGAVNGTYAIGGIVGIVQSSSGVVESCINDGAVTGSGDNVGGIVGNMQAGTLKGTITNNGAVKANKTVSSSDRAYNLISSRSGDYSGSQGLAKINVSGTDKYYSGTYNKISFVLDATSAVRLNGYSITNGSDNNSTNASQQYRTVKKVYIWGSNENNSGTNHAIAEGTYAGTGWQLIYASDNIGIGTDNNKRFDIAISTPYNAYRYYWVYLESRSATAPSDASTQAKTAGVQLSLFTIKTDNNLSSTGGIAGYFNGSTADGATLTTASTVTSSGYNVGGIFGYLNTSVNANFNVTTSASDAVSGIAVVGGAFGFVNSGATVKGTIIVNAFEIDKETGGNYCFGGAIGYNAGTIEASITVTSRVIVRGSGSINGYSGAFAGGIVGYNTGTILGATEKTGGDVLDVSKAGFVGGLAGFNSGTLSGNFTTIVTSPLDSNFKVIDGGQYVGGAVGYNIGNISGTSVINTLIKGTDYVGGFIGYNAYADSDGNGLTISGYTNVSAVTGNNYVGGIIGSTGTTLTIKNSSNNATIIGYGYVGGIVGGVVNATVAITNCHNSGEVNVTGGHVGGILGYTDGNCKIDIENCYNDAMVKSTGTAGNVGGIVGRAYTSNTDALAIKIFNCYNVGEISNADSDSAGGIVGHARSDSAGALVVKYCYNKAKISGKTYIGGIVGSIYTEKYATIENCYTTVDGTNTITATGTNVTTIGAIVGGAFGSPYATTNFNVINSWGFYSDATVLSGHNTGKDRFGAYVLVEGFDKQVYPIIDGETTSTDWTRIIEKQITSFYIESGISVHNGYYLALLKENHGEGTSVAKSFATPSNIDDLTITANTDGSTAFGIITYLADVAVSANQRNIHIYEEKIEYTAPDTEYTGPNSEFNKQGKAGRYIWNLQNSQTELRSGYLATFVLDTGDDVNVTEAGYTFDAKITADGVSPEKIFGQLLNEQGAKIVARKLTIDFDLLYNTLLIGDGNNIYRNDAFGLEWLKIGRVLDYGDDGNVITLNANNAMSGFSYSYQEEQVFTAVGKFSATNIGEYNYTITINSANYEFEYPAGEGTFVNSMSWSYNIVAYDLADHFNQGKVWFGANTQMVVTNNALEYVMLNDGNIASYYPLNRAQGATPQALVYEKVNYSKENFIIYVQYSNGKVEAITLDENYTLSDLETAGDDHVNTGASVTASGLGNFTSTVTKYYVVLDSDFGWTSADSNAKWGTIDNPYVISTQAQLMRLSQILNGGVAWNSINSDNTNIVLAKEERAVATDKTYEGAYFVVTNDIHLDETFKPIGNAENIFKATSFASNTDGELVTISYYYNDSDTVDSEYEYRDYVGLFGNVEGTHFKDLSVWGGAYNGGTSYTGKQIIGQNYVGGVVGKIKDGIVENCTFTSNVGGASIIGNNCVGGLIGYAENTQVLYDTSYDNMGSGDNLVSAKVTGVNYVGGIIGQWIIKSASQFNNGNANGLYFATTANVIVTSTGSYAGAIAGALDASECADNFEIQARLNVIAKVATRTVVNGVNYVGALYGSFIGNGTDTASVTYNGTDVWATIQFGGSGKVVGGFIGYLQDATFKFTKSYDIDNKNIVFEASSGKTPSFFGGVIGVLGKGANIANGVALDDNNKTFLTIKNTVDFGKDYTYGDFVGGVVGYVSSGAGRSNIGSTIFGDDLIFIGQGEIHANNYVGGIFGAIGIIDNYSIDDELLFNNIRYGSNTTTANANIVTFKPSSAKNIGGIYGANNVGGLVGGVFKKALIYLENPVTDADNPTFAVSNEAKVEGSTYVGGIVGYLEQESHVLNRIVNTGVIGKTDASYVGGLVGYMIGGAISNSVSASETAPSDTTDLYLGSKYVGGLVGFMQGGSLENSLSTGFKFDGNNTSLTKGGVVGDKLNPAMEGSWTIYIATNPTFATISPNKNGKYVLIDSSIKSEVGTFAYVLAMAGICAQTTYNNYTFQQGELLIGVKYPTKTNFGDVSDTKAQPKQLAFYDVSGSDSVMTTHTTVFASANGVVRIGVSMTDGESYSVCECDVVFKDIAKFTKEITDQDQLEQEQCENAQKGYKAPSGASDKYRAEVTTALYDSGGNITRIIANIYYKDVIIGAVEEVPEGVVGEYDSGTLTPGSEQNPYTISSQEEWNDFAWQIYTGQNDYKGKYVKLLENITIERKTTHTGTNNVSYNFDSECDWNSKTTDRGSNVKNAVSNKGYNFAGNITQGATGVDIVTVADVEYTNVTKVTPSFKGHFDGNGHTITINYDGIASGITDTNPKYQNRISAFPNAGNSGINTSFKNLTVGGSILAATISGSLNYGTFTCTNGAYDIAGFVGKPFGAIKFENCTNAANVTGLRVISGIAGCSTDTAPLELISCVNKGNITSYEMSSWKPNAGAQELGNQYDYQYGTGGIIAYATSSVTIESCLNTGDITGGSKIGGLVGRVTNNNNGLTTLVINNSANTGSIWSFEYNPNTPNDDKKRAANVWSRAGGLVGEVDYYTQAFIYASYNTGSVTALGNLAGGIVGIIGTIPGADSGNDKPGYTQTKYASTIAYCYNTGKITVGYKDYAGIPTKGTSGNNFNGSNAGGIVGTTGGVNISYCYNTGTIHAKGGVGGTLAWHTRNGGIVGEVTTHNTNGNIRTANISNCYNIGLLHFTESNSTDARYGADIIGYLETTDGTINVTNCYGVKNSILLGESTYKSGWNDTRGSVLTTSPSINYVRTGTTLDSFASLTAVMKSNASVGTIQGLADKWSASTSTIGAQDNANYKTGSLNGYIYMPGCLPQLAVFAVDTYNGLSMNSQNYGYDDNYGGYRSQDAGDEYSPYVIRDGIDLLGLQALVDLGYTFSGKYVEFADGTNNITLDKNMSSDTARVINMPTDGSSSRPSTTAAYKFSSEASPSLSTASDWKTGKSYHLYSLGGVCAQDRNTNTDTYNIWKVANYAYNTGGTLVASVAFNTQNFLSIGRNGGDNVFKGHISGAQTDGSVTEVANLRIVNKEVAGLFGYVQDAEVYSVGASGTVTAYANGTSTASRSIAGGIVAVAYGASIIDGCEAGSQDRPLYVRAYGTTQTYSDSNISNITTSAGGIVGLANTARYRNGSLSYSEGTTATISNNKVVNAYVSSAKNNIGGIVGFATGTASSASASNMNNKVEIASNVVESAKINASDASSATLTDVGTRIGGIIGYSDENVAIIVRECVVGTDSATNTVTIQGENRVGGIMGATPDAVNEIIGCKVLKSATISRGNSWGVVTNADEAGTAIGGIVGLTYNATGTDPITTTFSGNIVFQGTISIGVYTNYISASNRSNDGVVRNVGGIVGDMGSGARIATGSTIEVGGTIEISATVDDTHFNRNIGGVAGRTKDVAFSGTFKVAPTITATDAYQIGGFIGKNNGIVNILADDTDIEIGGNITASHDVGGFIGYNSESSTLLIGADQYRAVNYNDGLSIKIVMSVSDTETKATIDTLIKGDGDNVGGIVGNSEQNSVVKIVKGTIVNVGQVAGQNNVGGIIGINNGTLSTGGSVYDTTLEIINEGKVTGNDFVGGVIGKLNVGQIAGIFINRGNVSGRDYVGGSIGYVAKEASILSTGAGKTEFINEAVAIARQSDALVAADDAIADDSKFNVSGRYYVGGSIGLLLGRSLGNEEYKVEFRSKGTVDGDKYVGGSIGVLAGKTEYTDFISEGEMTGVGATTAVGGSVGFIGVPNPLIKDGTVTEADIVVSHTHFEANGTLTLNGTDGKPDGVGEYVWGGIGGAIGAIGNAEDNLFDNSANNRWTDNTYYASGNVTAEGFFHVGGIVGLIKADNITIENMLAYDTKVTGGKNVGGIVGATIGEKTVINSAYSISTNENGGIFTAPQGNAGGIIGLAQKDTDASTSYWVKGYTNAELAGSSVANLKTTLGRYTLAYEVYTLDGKEVTVVFTKELIGTGTTTGDEGGETGDEEVAIYPTPYAYYESVGTHKATNGTTYTIDEEEVTENGYVLIDENLTWQAYFDMTFGKVKVGTEEKSRITYQDDVGAWVEETSSWTEYSTGTKQTGWYFVYANDQQGGNNQIGTVDAVHSTATTEGYSDLWYWKRIANAYTMDERNAGYDDDTKANSPYAQNPLNSAIVRESEDEVISTVPHKGNLYATATAADFMTNANASGYYMYIASSGDTKPTSVYYDDNADDATPGKFFIQATGGVSQNVAVYYRSIAMGSALTYNGYERYAPISLSNDIKYDASIAENNENQDNKNLYFYNTDNKDGATPRVPNTYYTTVNIYYFDDAGKAYVVGGIKEGTWRINQRKLTFSATDVNGKVYGDEDIETTVTITNIALADMNNIEFALTIEGLNTPIALNLKNGAKFDENQGVTFSAVTVFQTSDVKLKGNDTKYNVKSLSTSDRETGKLTFNIKFKNAKNYKLSVALKTTEPSKYYTLSNANKQINVAQKELTIEYVNGEKSADFDNKTHGISWKVAGFVFGENLNSIVSLSPRIYANVDQDTNDYTTSLIENGVFASSVAINTSSGGRTSNIVVEVTQGDNGDNLIKLTGAKLKGTYYLAFDYQTAADCNYKFVTANDKVSDKLVISDNSLTVVWSSKSSDVYNKSVGSIIATVTATKPIEGLAAFVEEYFAISGNVKVLGYVETSTSKTVEIRFETKSYNVGTYKATLNKSNKILEIDCNCTTPTSKSYTITQRTLAFTYQMTSSGNSFEYNSYHQGLKTVTVSNICDGDSVQLGIGGDVTVAQSAKADGATITVASSDTSTNGTVDVGSYRAYVTIGNNTVSNNYKLPSDCTYSWSITKKSLRISGLTAQDVTYDGQEHRPNPTLSGATSQGNGVYKFGQDTIVINYNAGSELSSQSFVNAATYTISINTTKKVVAKHASGTDASENYDTAIDGNSGTTFTIEQRKINLTWTGKVLVYQNANIGQTLATVTADDGKVFTFVSSSITNAKFKGYAGNDIITFKVSGAQTNAGTGQMIASIDSVTGKNADGSDSSKDNYIINTGNSCDYTIDKMKVSVKYSSGRIADKVYDATTAINNLSGLVFAIGSTNATTTFRPNFNDVYTVSAVYASSDVGDWQLRLTYRFIGGANYEQEGELNETTSVAAGKITPATITVTLDRLRNGRATRTFAEDNNGNISVYYGGANGAVNGQRSNRSQTYRLGEGFTISGFPSVETAGVVRVLAKYVEVGSERALFDGYVNYIYDDGNGYVKGTATSDYVMRYNLYKALEFSIEDVNESRKAANYNFKVVDTAGDSITGDAEAQLGTADKAIRVYDANDQKNKNVGKQSITIEITVKTYKIKYGNTSQSYANSDGSYNKEWLPVEAVDLPSGINVDVVNGWRTDENGQPKTYKQYTVIRGSANSTELSASVSGSNGKQLNYNMTNQPVLTIGYFVEDDGNVFEIGSLSSLLIASYYWWVSANSENPEFNQVINTTVTWNALISDTDYSSDNPPTFAVPSGAPVPPDTVTTWDEYFLWLETENGITVFLSENENNTWGYYTTTTGAGDVKKYSSFKQIRDINGTFTQSDIEMLNGFFRVYDVASDSYITKQWGKGGEFITNFLKVGEGNVAVAIGSIFKSLENGFTGAYDGGGYVIEYFNIMSFEGAENVGMFDVLGGNATVKNLHLRNFNINANAGNVGGIAGKALASENAIENVSWHGTISMSGDGNVGGLIGVSARSINKAIALGAINAKGGNIGGLIGSIEQNASIAISNAVSFVYIDATGNVGAITASSSGATATNAFYLASSAWKRTSDSLTVSNGTYGTAKTYTQLIVGESVEGVVNAGSISGYTVVDGKKYYQGSAKGAYDMLDDFNLSENANRTSMNARQSMRLKDIIDVYMLMYSIAEVDVKVNATDDASSKVYTISSTSWLVGDKHGVDGDEIEIGNRQQVALLRELRFASFVLTSDVVATATSGGDYAYGGAFFGNVTVESGESYAIDFGSGKRAFEALATGSNVPYKQKV